MTWRGVGVRFPCAFQPTSQVYGRGAMVEQYIEQLTSRDPNRRRAAIIALSKTGDVRALGPLNSIAQNDPDPGLRELASKAEHIIQKARWEQVADQTAGLYVPRPAEPVERPPEVSPER